MAREQAGGGCCFSMFLIVGFFVVLIAGEENPGVYWWAGGASAVVVIVLVLFWIVQHNEANAIRQPGTTAVTLPKVEPAGTRQAPSNVDSLLRQGTATDEIFYMSGPEFERFMADFLRRQGYTVEETPLSGDQGVDLVLPDFDGKRVVQLNRWTAPVGNGAVQATFAGMAHYRAEEGWLITTSTFTKSARELARSTRVRLIDGKELAEWLEGLREQE